MDCIFCKIISGAIPSGKVFEDEEVFAFSDINKQAPTHVLIVPKKHIASLDHASAEDIQILGHLHAVAAVIARNTGLKSGYRTVINTGEDGGQTVDHLHVHLLGGRAMHWPPG
jgi:histidine triad (HIT) family protein